MDNNTSSESNVILLNTTATTLATTLFKQEQAIHSKQVTYRIPALIYISNQKKTFLAFAERRKTKDDTDAELLVMRRGSWKDGKKEVEWVSGHQVLTSAYLPNHRSMNPCPVYERETKTLFLFFICVPNGISESEQKSQKKNQARLCYITSKDNGETWKNITELEDVIREKEKNWATFAVGPGHGVQMESGKLIIPAYAYCTSCCCSSCCCLSCCCLSCCCFTPYALAFYSDDKGSTWKAGKQMDVESCECQMAEIINDKGTKTLYCNARTRLGYRTEALNYNSGEGFNNVLTPNKLKETGEGCQGSVLSFVEQSSPPKTWLLYSHPSDPKKRVNLGLYLNKSPLDSSGWSDEPLLILHQGPCAYSDLVEYEPGHFACLFECGKEHENEEIAFLRFELTKDAKAVC